MSNRPPQLPDYRQPPVSEVVLSLQFGSLSLMKSAHIGFLWARIRDRYPLVTEQGPLEPSFETFGTPNLQTGEVRFQQLLAPPFPRYWFESSDGSGLCQVQQDRLVHNWRKRAGEYPRYEAVRSDLLQDLASFEDFLKDEKLGSLEFNQSEISYINTIELPDGGDPHGALPKVLSAWADMGTAERVLEDVFFRARYLVMKNGGPNARLHVTVTPALRRADLAKVVQLELTFRGKPDGDDKSAALAMLDEGRIAIVTAFTELTTEDMHKHWGRIDV